MQALFELQSENSLEKHAYNPDEEAVRKQELQQENVKTCENQLHRRSSPGRKHAVVDMCAFVFVYLETRYTFMNSLFWKMRVVVFHLIAK